MSELAKAEDYMAIVEDGDEARVCEGARRWRILIVDDDPEVHTATRYALGDAVIDGHALELISAYSGAEGRQCLSRTSDIAVVLLDVVMEAHDSGLALVMWMRSNGFARQRIILRTGQPGYAPELDVIRNYDINDYRSKNELNQVRLITAMTNAIRTYDQLCMIERQRQSIENFAYALAHDFKQATRQIVTFSDMIVNRKVSLAAPQAERMLSFLGAASRRLETLVDTMAQYTLLCHEVEMSDVELRDVFDDVKKSLLLLPNASKWKLEFQGGGCYRTSRPLLGHVLNILVVNGLQHNESEVPQVRVTARGEKGGCMIDVQDNGVGITSSDVEKIFKPYMRLRQSPSSAATGLGLTMCRRAVEALGGSITCTSQPGKGSVFRVCLS